MDACDFLLFNPMLKSREGMDVFRIFNFSGSIPFSGVYFVLKKVEIFGFMIIDKKQLVSLKIIHAI